MRYTNLIERIQVIRQFYQQFSNWLHLSYIKYLHRSGLVFSLFQNIK